MKSGAQTKRKSTAECTPTVSPSARRAAGAAETFDPRVLIFACNWCSYAGADTAGVSRLQQMPHFRLLRVMCSGRVHPAFVLRAFAQGADGVMVSGCHYGDCHYSFGNYRAADQFAPTAALVELLGLDERRLRLEWVSAAEGVRFAELMNEFIEQVRSSGPSPLAPRPTPADANPASSEKLLHDLLHRPHLFQCLECGRCTGVCPVARYQTFSPRRLISRALALGGSTLAGEPSLWTCLTCNRCQAVCPTGVDYDRFILAARAAAVAAAGSPITAQIAQQEQASLVADAPAPSPIPANPVVPCSHGGVFEQINLMMARPQLRQKRLGWLADDLDLRIIPAGHTDKQRLLKGAAARPVRRKHRVDLLYVGCSPYFAAYFGGQTGDGLTATMRSAVRLLNRAGITPRLLENERCCGYHLRLSGRIADADALEERVLDQLQRSGAHRIITFCPECLIGLRQAAARRGAALEIVHLSSLLWGQRQALQDGAARPSAAAGSRDDDDDTHTPTVTYQDPCRLGRYARIYDAPRDLLQQVGGTRVAEMAHHHQNAICCGNTAWLSCNAGTKRLQTARLEEAVATGGERLLTACPGCFIHLRCTQEGLEDQDAGKVVIEDLWSYLERHLAGQTEASPAGDAPHEEQAGFSGRQAKRRNARHE